MFDHGSKPSLNQTPSPLLTEERLVAPAIPRPVFGEQVELHNAPAASAKPSNGVRNAAAVILSSQGVWNGTGAVCASLVTGFTGAAVQLAATVLTARNEAREAGAGPARHPDTGFFGYRGLLRDAWYSPGVITIIGAAAFGLSAVQAVAQGELLRATVYGLFAAGNSVVTVYANRTYRGTRLSITGLERTGTRLWGAIPERIRNLTLNPGPWFGTGNVALAVSAIGEKGVAAQGVADWCVPVGVAFVAIGVARTVRQAVRAGHDSRPDDFSVRCNGFANALFSASAFLRGDLLVGAAQGCWTISNLLLARLMRRTAL